MKFKLCAALVFAAIGSALPVFAQSAPPDECSPFIPRFGVKCINGVLTAWPPTPGGGPTPSPEPVSVCGARLQPLVPAGEYTMKVGDLLMMINGNPMHPDPASEGTLTLNAGTPPEQDLVLTGLPEGMPPEIRLRQVYPEPAPEWAFLKAPVQGVDLAGMSADLPCNPSELPDLEATFRTRSQDGFDIDNAWRMVALSERHFIGIWTFSPIGTPYPVVGTRSIEMELE